jgi:ABC-type Fe3+-siderophore transport system permease subunit
VSISLIRAAAFESFEDIIALLIVGILFIVMFILWQHHLEKNEGRPPLMKLSLWARAKGKFAVMQAIAFFEWAGFISWYFWAQVNSIHFVFLCR